MADAAENLDTGVENIVSDDGGAWKETLAGDNAEVLESLNEYESPDKFMEAFNTMKNHDWRDDFAGDDLKFKSTLDRFKSPMEFSNSWREAQQKIRGGELNQQQGLPQPAEGATEDDIKAFREQHGIPLEAEGYFNNLPDGVVIGEDDKVYFDDFAKDMHEANMPPELAPFVATWYNKFMENEQTARVEGDREHKQEMEDGLRDDWGPDFRANMNLFSAYLKKSLGEEAHEAFVNARGLDGRGILNNRDVVSWLTGIARKENPELQLVQPGGDAMQTLNDEIAALEKYMAEDRTKYNNDVQAQERLKELYQIRIDAEKK